ncbi:alkyl hydroperoxide reductase/ Thiol specific antioxidant/ Mal allergen [Chloroherpeton thalassium ATCC 35110]|uniref:Alkyl hydroperoxide reductase/ Thiol specific antioxidant/ Mal allergen n=1 Tax=Chloroherpeton thalassium (strain ATCC 35110 / GB-78) TaxID=517418 RepID=B3QY93_CHLT3|nr:peroxiredoxin family protein [Chloroherpeton thalassium]ACF15059.1 alkyl hydroperoxide reductase/ Thiol specific antioxidant/ Mal allergen [Chloroherpeton thalassium ATCC 35110]
MSGFFESINPINGKFIENLLPRGTKKNVKVGDLAPDFSLPDGNGNSVTLSSFRGKRVLLVFTRIYTDKIICPLCYPHLSSLKKDFSKFQELDTEVIVVNTTSAEMTREIVASSAFPFTMLSDEQWKVFELYGLGAAAGAPLPGQFIVGREGKILFVYTCDRFPNHPSNEEMFALLKQIAK